MDARLWLKTVVNVGNDVLAGSDQLDWSQVKIAVGVGNDALTVYLTGLMTCWIGPVGCSAVAGDSG